MTEFVSKPQHVEAVQWTGSNGPELIEAFNGKVTVEHRGDYEWFCNLLAGVDGAQQWVPVPVGHWLVHPVGDLSDIWPVEDGYFQAKYGVDDARQGDYSIGSDVWPGLSKVVEEMGEALQVLGKVVGAGGGTEYWGGLDLREKLVEELADVMGSIGYFAHHNLTADEVEDLLTRSELKRDRFEEWHTNGHDPKDVTR